MADAHRSAGEEPPLAPGTHEPTRADALRRIAAEVSGRHDLDGLFRDVIDEAFTLFGVDQAGLWLFEDGPTPLHLVAQRGLSAGDPRYRQHAATRRPDGGHGRAARTGGPGPQRRPRGDPAAAADDLPARRGQDHLLRPDRVPRHVRSACSSCTTCADYAWTPDETEVARAFADHMATAIGNARLAESTRTMADRLRAISELAGRLNRLQDVEGIAQAIVAEARLAHRPRHDPRLPGRPRQRDVRADRASRARSWASTNPDPAILRVADRRRA